MLSTELRALEIKEPQGATELNINISSQSEDAPQGGVGSPIYWNMVIKKLITILHGLGIHVVAYADDLAAVFPL